MTHPINKEIQDICRRRLLMMKDELMNRARHEQREFSQQEKFGGDEIDQSSAQIAEEHFLLNQDRMRKQLMEIEWALARLQSGEFGVCEETQEPIEAERLMALPYTRLSIEGAEIREQLRKKRASF